LPQWQAIFESKQMPKAEYLAEQSIEEAKEQL
jgi:hypothetical protein